MKIYSKKFYNDLTDGSIRSAREIVPWILDNFEINSIVDVGCGNGSWLAEFIRLGIQDVIGYDGKWVNKEQLRISEEKFIVKDFTIDNFDENKADFAMSVEVAEHIPEEYADKFVQGITQIAPVVFFSAAIPKQGGTHHVNEQWHGYWKEKFKKRGYLAIDCIRPTFWENKQVDPWFRQNAIVYIHTDLAKKYKDLIDKYEKSLYTNIVNPDYFLNKVKELTDPESYSFKKLIPAIPRIIVKKLKYRFR